MLKRLVIISQLCGLLNCSKQTADTIDSDITVTTIPVPVVVEDGTVELNLAYPSSLTLSVFPTDNATALRLADSESAPETIKGKAEEAKKYLAGTADTCLPAVFLRPAVSVEENCYEFDQEMLVGKRAQTEYGTVDGKSKVFGSTEACLVSFSRAQIKSIENMIDLGLGLQQGMICQALKDKVDVADADTASGVDLKESLGDAMSSGTDSRKPTITVSKANMNKNLSSEGKDVYHVEISVTITSATSTYSQTYELSHAPDDASNSTYHGVMTLTRTDSSLVSPTLIAESSKTQYISVTYSKVSEAGVNRLKAELRSAKFAAALADLAIDSSGEINFNAGAKFAGASTDLDYGSYVNPSTALPYAQVNEAVDGILFVGYNLNIDDNTGTFEYWKNPGGSYNEAARGMVFAIEKDSLGLFGCGMSGAVAQTSIRKAVKAETELVPTGFYHPFFVSGAVVAGSSPKKFYEDTNSSSAWDTTEPYWFAPTLADTAVAETWANSQTGLLVSRQCVRQDAASGEYRIDSSKITEAAGFELFNPSNSPALVIARPERPPAPPETK